MTSKSLVFALALASFTGILAQFALVPLLPEVAADIDVSVPLLAQTVTLTFLAGALLALAIGPLADHYGHRRLMLIGATLLLLSAIGTSLAVDYWTVLLTRLPGGLGGGILTSVSVVLASTRFPVEQRRWAIGWTVSGISMAPIIGVPIITFVGEYLGWRASFIALGLLALVSGLLLRWLVSADTFTPVERFHLKNTLGAYRPILINGLARRLQICNLLRAIGWGAALTYISAYMFDVHGLSLQGVSYLFFLTGCGYFLGTRLGDGRYARFSLHNTFALSTLAMGLMFAAMYLIHASLWIIITPLTIAVAAGGIGFVSLTIIMAEENTAGPATTMMLRQSGFSLGLAGGAVVGGLALALGGYDLLGICVLAFAITSALSISRPLKAQLPAGLEPPPAVDPVAVTPAAPPVNTERV
jgi:MFS transporter, DHA1 family, inner membrane transport protein